MSLDLHGKFVSATFERLVQLSAGLLYDASGNLIDLRLNQCITVTADHTVVASDAVILCDASLGNIEIFLETALLTNGTSHNIKKIDSSSNYVTITAIGGQFIDGDTTQIITTKNDNVTVVSNGSNWFII